MSSMYRVKDGAPCPACGYGYETPEHYRIHVPRYKWPESMGKRKHRVVVNGQVMSVDEAVDESMPRPLMCDCGFEATNERALKMHQRRARVHREVAA